MRKRDIVNRGKIRLKKQIKTEGFTLVELLGVVAVLSVLLVASISLYSSIKNKVLQQDYENMISLIETKAANYAEDTGITTVSVEKLIAEGYLDPDDETDVYNPITNESINCYVLKSEFKDDEYSSSLLDTNIKGVDGKCMEYEITADYEICRMDDAGNCNRIHDEWLSEDITLGVFSTAGTILDVTKTRYEWTSNTGIMSQESTITTHTASVTRGLYKVNLVTKIDDDLTNASEIIGVASKTIKIDKQAPVISDVNVKTAWDSGVVIMASDFDGSGVKGIAVGKFTSCPVASSSEYKTGLDNNSLTIKLDANEEYSICAVDNVGNVTGDENLKKIKVDYIFPIVTIESTNKTFDSITLNVVGTRGSSEIQKYMYSIDNGASWKESSTSSLNDSFTFKELESEKTYNIKVKVVDSSGMESQVVSTSVKLEYQKPSVEFASTSSTTSSISVNVSAKQGSTSIAKYMYSTNGTSWTTKTSSSLSNSNTFSSLSSNTNYTIRVKVVDSNGRESAVITKTIKTAYEYSKVTITGATPTADSITINAVGTRGSGALSKYMYSKDGGSNWVTSYSSQTSNSYTFTGLKSNTTYQIKVKVVDSNGYQSSIASRSVTTTSGSFAEYLKSVNPNLEFTGFDPANYVCFNTNSSYCSEDNLYRVLGVYGNQVKLVKYSLLPDKVTWASQASYNYWQSAIANQYLNTTYYNSLGYEWREMIAMSSWSVRGNDNYQGRIGLLYASEVTKAKDWLVNPPGYMGYGVEEEWLMDVSMNSYVYRFTRDGVLWQQKHAYCNETYCTLNYVRPTFKLVEGIKKVSGSGTKYDPYRISL